MSGSASDLAVELTADGQPSRYDVVVTRFTPEGDVVSTRQLDDPTANVELEALAVPSDGGLIATGVTLPPYSSQVGDGRIDTFLARWDSDGNLLWTRTMASATSFGTVVEAIAIATDGSVAIAGSTSGLVGQPSTDAESGAFVAKLDATGTVRWIRVLGIDADDRAIGVAFDARRTCTHAV